METIVLAIVVSIVLIHMAHERGESKGYIKGVADASGWRDEMIEQYKEMVVEALRQRDEARGAALVTPPNPFARTKDLN